MDMVARIKSVGTKKNRDILADTLDEFGYGKAIKTRPFQVEVGDDTGKPLQEIWVLS